MDIFEIDILGREVKFIEKEKSEAQLIPIKRRRRTPVAAQHPSSLPQNDLSLWLKADVGVSLFSFDYKSQIVVSGTSNPSFAGTYTYTGTPTYSDGSVDSYFFDDVPSGKVMSWSKGDGVFFLQESGGLSLFQSSDGANWSAIEPYVSQVTITGFTGVYSGANGVYTRGDSASNFEKAGGGFYIDSSINTLVDSTYGVQIATNNNNYQGAWTPATFINQVTLSGAGSSYVNGVYTRTSPGLFDDTAFSGPTSLTLNEGEWWLGAEAYSSLNLINWYVFNTGDEPAPTSVVTTAPKPVGSPTSTTVSYPSGSISGSVTISTANTDNVTAWADQSGNARNADAYSGSFPTYSLIGGKSFVSFAAFVDLLVTNTIWGASIPFIGTIFTVARFPSSSSGGNARLFGAEANTNYFVFGRGIESTNVFFVTNNQEDYLTSVSALNNNTNYILETTFDENNAAIYLNGTLAGDSSVSSNTGVGSEFIGGGEEPSSIAEMIVYNRVLTDTERLQVETYLNQKYQIY